MECRHPEQIHVPSGLCYGLGTFYLRVKFDGRSGAEFICTDHYYGGMAMVNTPDKWIFLRDNPLFRNIT